MELPILYKRAKTGAIQFWKVWTNGPKVIKQSGKLGTSNPIEHRELCIGKNIGKSNETSPEQQAELQAKSDWTRKHDEGYKTLENVGILSFSDGYSLSINEERRPLAEILDKVLTEFNTDASGNVKPMLAPTKCWVFGNPKNRYPVLAEYKLNGVRATIVLDWKRIGPDMDVSVQILSRTGKPYDTLSHIADILKEAMQDHWDSEYEQTLILDGEVYKHGWLLEEISEAVKKYRPGITEELEFWIYDLPLSKENQKARTNKLLEIVSKINHIKISRPIEIPLYNDQEVQDHHDQAVSAGYEGLMLKAPDGTYEQGVRSRYWTKVKMFDETEFKIIGYTLGQRGIEDLMFICAAPGGPFEVKLSGSTAFKQQIWDEYIEPGIHIGKNFTVKHFGYTKYKIPYIPTGKGIRHDK
jgi:ATP-dependent DNA ligase